MKNKGIEKRKDDRVDKQAEGKGKGGDLADDGCIVRMPEKAIGSRFHERRAGQDDDACRPAVLQRRQHPEPQRL